MSFKKQIRLHVVTPLKKLSAPYERSRYFRSSAAPKINVGCGKNILDGWLNVDLFPQLAAVQMNAATRWPFEEGTFDAAFCEHMIEHVSKDDACRIIEEMRRTLRPGGAVRIVTPDLASFAKMALSPEAADSREYVDSWRDFLDDPHGTPCDAVNAIFYEHGHRYIYSVDELSGILTKAGFANISVMRGGQYRNPVFQGLDGHPNLVGQRMNEIEAFAIEAYRP